MGLAETNTNVLFLDGDCIPSDNLFEHFNNELDVDEPTIVISQRRNSHKDGINISDDSRLTTPWYVGWIFDKECLKIKHLELSRIRMLTWSCSLGINLKAISLIKSINEHLGYSNRLFPSIFDGHWGGEDDYIGHVAMFMNIQVIGLAKEDYVIHIWHESRVNNEYIDRSKVAYDKLLDYCKSIDAPGLPFADIDIHKHIAEYVSELRTGKLELDVVIDEPFDD